jgi:Na+/proline symporter
MQPEYIFLTFMVYTLLLFAVSFITSRKADNESFFTGNRVSPWYVVAYGMIGASLSGVTFISVPGAVGKDSFSYLVMVLGYFIGYLVIIKILLPLYYRLNVISIYSYFRNRFGFYTYKSGASYFLLSRIIGASFRMYLIISVLQAFVFDSWHIPFWVTVALFIGLIMLYTFKAGIKTIVWTDTLQTTFMLASVFLTLWFISDHLNLGMSELFNKISKSDYSKVFITDWHHPRFFVKQFVAGMFMSIVMTGMDQDMMQKNLTCRTLKDSQKNMFWMSFSLIPINLIFLLLGAALYIYAASTGMTLPEKSDHLFPAVALGSLGPVAGVTFIIGLVAAAYSSADSALTALTTSFSIDILGIDKEGRYTKEKQVRIRKLVHFAVAFTLFLVIILFNAISRESVINELFKIAGYTYGPLLGLFAFGLFTKYKIYDKGVVAVVIAAPVISYLLNIYSKQLFNNYVFGFELLIINGLLTFAGLFLIRRKTI